MKRSFLLALCLSAAAAFAGVYDIADFTAKDAVSSDNQIFASYGELNTVSVDEAASVPSGKIVLRQKFAQESGINAYQLYIGDVGDISSMTALSVPSTASYKNVVKSKLYVRRGMKPGDDAEKVYFDGKFVYIPGATSAIAFVNGVQVDLKGEAPAESASAPKQECDEFDVSCDEDIIAAKSGKNYDASCAFRIWKRDRFNHKSPNAAQTESAAAGSLGLQLAGDAQYFGKVVSKPFIGDKVREIEPFDIVRVNRLMTVASFMGFTLCTLAIYITYLTAVR